MKIIALGGSGMMGRIAARRLAHDPRVQEIVIADLDLDAAQALATELAGLSGLGASVTAVRADVTDGAQLRALFADADLVINTVGPYYRFGVPVLEAAIDARTHYIDICDDPEPTVGMIALDARAREARITAIVGMGASPGFTNVLGALATRGLTDITVMRCAWAITTDRGYDLLDSHRDGKSAAAVEHLLEQITGTVTASIDGSLVETLPLRPVRIDLEGLGSGTAYTVGHPEPVAFHHTYAPSVAAECFVLATVDRAAEMTITKEWLETGVVDLTEAARLFSNSEDALVRTAVERSAEFEGLGTLPEFFVTAQGTLDGAVVTQFAALDGVPHDLDEITGIPLAVAVGNIIGRELPVGVLTPDTVIEPETFLRDLAAAWRIDLDSLLTVGSVRDSTTVGS